MGFAQGKLPIFKMKVAIVHELLTMRGGAENVAKIFADMFPKAPVFTLLYDEKKLGDLFPKERVRTSTLQPFAPLSTNHHLYLPYFRRAVEAWDFGPYDLVLSSSSAFAHGCRIRNKTKHLSYVHSPARYLWDRTHDVLERSSAPKKLYGDRLFPNLRVWDCEASDRAHALVAASAEVQRRIQLYWRKQSDVVHPPVADTWFEDDGRRHVRSHFLIVSTLAAYKRIDIAVEACTRLNMPLKIAGTGAEMERLKRLAGPTVEFLGYLSPEELKPYYRTAYATLVPGEEDFGLVPVESMACGTPVIALGKGGPLETVINGETGMFFHDCTAESLASVLASFDHKKYAEEKCRVQANRFTRSDFVHKMESQIGRLMAMA